MIRNILIKSGNPPKLSKLGLVPMSVRVQGPKGSYLAIRWVKSGDIEKEKEKRKSIFDFFMDIFKIDKNKAEKKIKEDYDKYNIKKEYNLSQQGWKEHLQEYFSNKDKYDKQFSEKKDISKDKKITKVVTKKTKEGIKKTTTKKTFNLSLLRNIYNIYGKYKELKDGKDKLRIRDGQIPTDYQKIQPGEITGNPIADVPEKQPSSNKTVDVLGGIDIGERLGRDVRLTPSQIKEKRNQILDLLKSKTDDEMTEEDKMLLRQYEGAGGLKEEASVHGTLYEYYTPKTVVNKIWDIVNKYIGTGKKDVLEPSSGIGRFAEGQDHNFTMYEVDETSSRINKILYPNAIVENKAFQELFMPTGIVKKEYTGKKFDVAIGNPPYGQYSGIYKGKGEGKEHKRYEEYFIDRGLDSLKEGGIMAYVVPSSFLRGNIFTDIKSKIAKKGRILEAYRLPNGTFQTTGIGTDIIIIRKERGNVDDFLDDKYFKNNPSNILGEETTRSGKFGPEKYVKLKDGLTFDDSIDSINPLDITVVPAGRPSLSEEAKANISTSMKGNKNAEKLVKKVPEKEITEKKKNLETIQSFNEKYNKKFDKDELNIWKATDYNGNIDFTKLSESEKNIVKADDNFCFINNKFIHKTNYVSGNIYNNKLQLEKDKESISKKKYDYQKSLLESATPPFKTVKNFTVSPISDYAKNFMVEDVTLIDKFFRWATNSSFKKAQSWDGGVTKHDIPSGVSWSDIVDYIDQKPVMTERGGDPVTNKIIAAKQRELRREIAEKLFNRFLDLGLTEEEKNKIELDYNYKFNSYVAPDYNNIPIFIDGISKTFKGKDLIVKDAQLRGASFLGNKGNGLLAYDVGVGKTLTGIIATINQIQTGRAKKPVICVPKAVYKNWIAEIRDLFPNIEINEIGNLGKNYVGKDFKIKDGTLSIMTYEALQNITFKEDTMNQELINDITDSQETEAEGKSERERALEAEKIFEKLGIGTKVKTNQFFIEDLGFDHITIDEVHNFKNVFGQAKPSKSPGGGRTTNEFKNLMGGTSDRALKMFTITQHIQRNNNDRNVFALSATPFTNSPLEIYNILSLVARKRLKELGIYNLHEFMARYAKLKSEWSSTTKGTIERKDVMKEFQNLSSLQNLIKEYMDKIDGEEAGIERPNKYTHVVELPMTVAQKALFKAEQGRFDKTAREEPGAALKAINNMRMSTLSMNLVNMDETNRHIDISGEDLIDDSPKLKFTFDSVVGVHAARPDLGQVVYLPRGVPNFPQMKSYLVKKGIDEKSIATIKSGMSNDVIERIKADFNNPDGKIKIIMGSETIKEGINLNGNTAVVYNTMLGWNPSERTQVEGRAWRQGNNQENVQIVYPQIVDSVDSAMYQKHDEKSKRFDALWSYKGDNLNVEDISAEDLKFDLIKDPERRAQFQIDMKVEDISNQKRDKYIFVDMLTKYKDDHARFSEEVLSKKEKTLPVYQKDLADAEKELSTSEKKLTDYKKKTNKKEPDYKSNIEEMTKEIGSFKDNVKNEKKYLKELLKEIDYAEKSANQIEAKLNDMGVSIETIEKRVDKEKKGIDSLVEEENNIKNSRAEYIKKARAEIESQKKDVLSINDSIKKQISLILAGAKPLEVLKASRTLSELLSMRKAG